MSKDIYLNFPIQLLQGFMIDTGKENLNNIVDYVIYKRALNLEFGTNIEKIKTSADFYNMTLRNAKKTLENGKTLYNSISENSPKVGLSISIFWDFYKNEKTEFDKACFLAFLGIKSIIGAKPYHKATNLFLWSRMDGKTNSIAEASELSNEVKKYANEYQTKKIKTALRNNWGLVTYARHTRGFYVSFKITLKQLILEAEKRRISTKEKQYKEQEKNVLKEVLEQLKNTRPK